MVPFLIEGVYAQEGNHQVREWCYDPDGPSFVVRRRRWATDGWEEQDRFDMPSSAGVGLLNALAHAHSAQALLVLEFLQAHGPQHTPAPA